MEQSLSWEADSISDWQEIPCVVWNPKVCYCVQKSPSFVFLRHIVKSMLSHLVYFWNPTLYMDSFPLMGMKRPDILNIHDRRNCKEKFSGWKAMPFGWMQDCRCSFSLTLKIHGKKEYWYFMLIMSWFIESPRVFVMIMVADLGFNVGGQFER